MAPPVTCTCGSCKKCKHRSYMRQWYARPENTDRHRETARLSRNRRIEKARAYDRARGHRVYDSAKERVRAATYRAIVRGLLIRQPCEVCGGERVEAHHEDYAKPLEVRWLCRLHHMELHRRVGAAA